MPAVAAADEVIVSALLLMDAVESCETGRGRFLGPFAGSLAVVLAELEGSLSLPFAAVLAEVELEAEALALVALLFALTLLLLLLLLPISADTICGGFGGIHTRCLCCTCGF